MDAHADGAIELDAVLSIGSLRSGGSDLTVDLRRAS